MQILNGLQSHQVLQRNAKNVCQVLIDGKAKSNGILQMQVLKNNCLLKGFANKKIAKISKGTFSFWLRGIPVGGPYAITLRLIEFGGGGAAVVDEVVFEDIFVGDVWVLAGQSNMQGYGYLKDAAKPHPNVRAFYMDDHWAMAKDPIHQLEIAVDSVHTQINGGQCIGAKHIGTGPGVAFGCQMYEYTKVPQGLIPCAHGGTSMDQWDPGLKKKANASLYGAMLRRFVKNGSNVAGILWYQGCSEAWECYSGSYTTKMKKFVFNVRSDFGNALLPFVMVQIAGVFGGGNSGLNIKKSIPHWNSVREQQRNLPEIIKRLVIVPAIDLSYDDLIHISGKDQNRLGKRLARAAIVLTKGRKYGKSSIKLIRVEIDTNKSAGTVIINVDFANVEGKLQAAGRANGFNLIDNDGNILDSIYRVDLEGYRAILHTNLIPSQMSNLSLHYGWGLTTYCNITDSADRSLPAFGPVSIKNRYI